MDNDKEQVQELWALPIGSKPAVEIDSTVLYSSVKLKLKFIKAMMKTNKTKPFANSLLKMIERNKIIPCWMNKGIFSLSLFKIFAPAGTQSIMGFYSAEDDFVCLILDNNITFGYASNHYLAILTTHELMHMSAAKTKMQFLNTFKEELDKYYTALFTSIFDLDSNKKGVDKAIRNIYTTVFKQVELDTNTDIGSYLPKYYKLLRTLESYSKLDEGEFKDKAIRYMTVAKYITNIDGYIRNMHRYRDIVRPMYKAYKTIMKGNLRTLCIQELIFPSEVICIWAEYSDSGKIKNSIRSIENK